MAMSCMTMSVSFWFILTVFGVFLMNAKQDKLSSGWPSSFWSSGILESSETGVCAITTSLPRTNVCMNFMACFDIVGMGF